MDNSVLTYHPNLELNFEYDLNFGVNVLSLH